MEWLPTTAKPDRRGRSKSLQISKPSLLLAFFSCVAWLYIVGRLWQDSENKTLLVNLLQKNAEQRPKVLTVEDKLVVFGCKDLESRIVEAEMELTMAKSQGYLKHQLRQGWHTIFWIAFIPFTLLLAVGTKLEHVVSQLAHEVAEKHVAIEGELVVRPSDEHFWFNKPRMILYLIHFILFQNAFEIAIFFWILVQFGFESCIMEEVAYVVPRLVIGVIIQVLCSYNTQPLYATVAQMGSTLFKKSIFDEHVQAGIVGWAEKVKKKKAMKTAVEESRQSSCHDSSSVAIQLGRVLRN